MTNPKVPEVQCANTGTHDSHEWDDTTQLVFPVVYCPGISDPFAGLPALDGEWD